MDAEKLAKDLGEVTTIAELVRLLLDNHIDFRFQIGEYPRPHKWTDITEFLMVKEVLAGAGV